MSKQGACGDCSCSCLSWCLHSRTASGEKKKYNYVYGNGGKLLKINPIPFLGRNMVAWSWSICWCYVITNSDFFLPWSWRWCKTRHIIHCVLFLIPVSFLFNTGRAWNLFSKTLMLKTNALNFFFILNECLLFIIKLSQNLYFCLWLIVFPVAWVISGLLFR